MNSYAMVEVIGKTTGEVREIGTFSSCYNTVDRLNPERQQYVVIRNNDYAKGSIVRIPR